MQCFAVFQRLPGAAGTGNLFRTERIGAVQRYQQRATHAYKGFQAALCVQLVTGLYQHRIQRFRCDRIEEVANLTGRGDLMDSENRLRIVLVVVLLHPSLIVQKGRALREKDRERAKRAAYLVN